jgi:hypothetical protein
MQLVGRLSESKHAYDQCHYNAALKVWKRLDAPLRVSVCATLSHVPGLAITCIISQSVAPFNRSRSDPLTPCQHLVTSSFLSTFSGPQWAHHKRFLCRYLMKESQSSESSFYAHQRDWDGCRGRVSRPRGASKGVLNWNLSRRRICYAS